MKAAPPNGKGAPGAPATRVSPGGSVDKGSKGSIDKASMDKGSIDRASIDKGGAKGAKPAKTKVTPEQRKQMMVVGVSAAVVLVVGIGMFFYFNRKPAIDPGTRVNAPPVVMAKYITSADFDQLDFSRQYLYMKKLSDQKEELEAEYKAGKFAKADFEEVLAIIWLGKQFNKVDEFHALGPIDKKEYLDEVINKELIEQALEDLSGAPKDPNAPKRNKDKVRAIEDKMTDYHKRQYKGFHQALKDREKEREKENKGFRSATRPATRPAERAAPAEGAAAPVTPVTGK